MANIDAAIKWFKDRAGKITYSMDSRRGPDSYDCSSSVYYALIAGGFFPVGIFIGNTETEFNDLEKYGWKQIKADKNGNFPTVKGDVFIWGVRGDSSGALGHTGMFVDTDNVIHTSYYYNGVHTNNYDALHTANGMPPAAYYHYGGSSDPVAAAEKVDQVINPGSYIKFPGTYKVDGLQSVADSWQIKTSTLCAVGFTWADNGIPASPLVEVDADGYATPDQVLAVGSKYKIPGKYQVLDVGQSGNAWLGQIEMAGMKLWVDLAPVIEVGASDAGTPKPVKPPAHAAGTKPVTPADPVLADNEPATSEKTPAPVETPVPAPEVSAQSVSSTPVAPVINSATPVATSTPKFNLLQLILTLIKNFVKGV